MFHAFARTLTEILDSKKAAYSFAATAIAVVLHLKFGVSAENALLLVSPLSVAIAAQAHVNGKRCSANAAAAAAAAAGGSNTVGSPAQSESSGISREG